MPGAPQSYLQWEKDVPKINPAFIDGAGPGPGASSNIIQELIWSDHFGQYENEAAALVNWSIDGPEWTFIPQNDNWSLSGAQIVASKLTRLATAAVQIGDVILIQLRVDADFPFTAGFEVRYDAQQVITGIDAPGEYAGTVVAAAAGGLVIVEGSTPAIGRIGYVSLGFNKAFNVYRDANDNPITVA